jgi:hypothetical protein
MRLIATICAVLPTLITTVYADWSLYAESCATGLDYTADGFSGGSAGTASQGNCGGVATVGNPDVGAMVSSRNPCNLDDPTTISYIPNDQTLNMYVNNEQIGYCYVATTDVVGACNEVEYACSTLKQFDCITTYCN